MNIRPAVARSAKGAARCLSGAVSCGTSHPCCLNHRLPGGMIEQSPENRTS